MPGAVSRRSFLTLAAGGLVAASAFPCEARTSFPISSSMPTYGAAALVPQWVKFAALNPTLAYVPPAVLRLDAKTWWKLHQIANPVYQYVPDPGADDWRIPTNGRGDCEDIVLARRAFAVRLGLPLGCLRPIICENPLFDPPGHLTLCVVTDHGDYILDLFSRTPTPWASVPYRWIARLNHGLYWEMLTP